MFRTKSVTEDGSQNELDSGSINYLALSIFFGMQLFSAVIFYFLCDTTKIEEIQKQVNYKKKRFIILLIVVW